jgi:fatty acid/phospholipid biosynthesis enzyme
MVAILKANKAVNAWTCVQEANAEACMAAVELGAADVVSVGASAVFKASEKFGVQLIAGEVRPLVFHVPKSSFICAAASQLAAKSRRGNQITIALLR